MNFDEIVRARKSVRSFKKKKVNFRDILDAVEAANQGAFAGNHNHMNYLIVENKETIEEIARHCEQVWIAEAPVVVLVFSDDKHLENMYGERGRVYSRQQAGAAIKVFMLKLTELGLGSCWVGAYDDPKIRTKLGVPQDLQIEGVIPIGYSNDLKEKKEKRSIESTIYWERWENDKKPTTFQEEKHDFRPGRFD